MKKVLCFIISLIMLFPLVVACDNNTDNEGGDTQTPASAISITVDGNEKTSLSMIVGAKIDVVAKLTGLDNKKTEWSSNDESVVVVKVPKSSISYESQFQAKSEGTATVTATASNGNTASIEVTVRNAQITTNVTEVHLYLNKVNDSFDVKQNVSVTDGGVLSYSVTDNSIISINDGVIKPLKEGVAHVTVTEKYSKKESKIKVIVHQGYIDVTRTGIIIAPNEEVALPFSSKITDVTYQIADTSVAKIENNKIKGVAVGKTTITATYLDETHVVEIEVLSSSLKSITVDSNLTETYVNYYGRNYYSGGAVQFCYGASGFEVKFYGTSLSAYMYASLQKTNFVPEMQVLVDGEQVPLNDSNAKKIVLTNSTAQKVTLVSNLSFGFHTVKVLKRSGYISGNNEECRVALTKIETDGYIDNAPTKKSLKIDIYGDSITHGYGNLKAGAQPYAQDTNALLTYGYLTAQKLNAQVNIQGHSGWCMYLSNDNVVEKPTHVWGSKYLYYNPKKTDNWDFNKYQADIIVINIGTNDGFGINAGGGLASSNYSESGFIANYKAMIDGLKAKCPNAKFVLCYGMMGTNSTVWSNIKTVANNYDYAYALNFTDYRDNRSGHPLVEDHSQNATQLYNKINEILNS